ncbi:MAG: glycerophosphodiester phosphodiesterase family protein, partial [Rubrobacteraceae bacterium]
MIRVVGHRGAAGIEPENTLRSFQRAAREGADAIELDLRVSRDRHLVVMHDPTVDRTTDGTGLVSGMSLAGLQDLDAGFGERIPTFEEVLEATDLPIHAELKEVGAVEPLAKLVWRRGMTGRVTAISFDLETLFRVRVSLPELPVGLILPGASSEG